MQRSRLSLKWLEVFQLAARSGSVQEVASETGLSVSTVSHHIQSLEKRLGVSLLDHNRRPMVLTPAGNVFLRYIEEALSLIRKAEIEAVSGNMIEARSLRLGMVDDFDAEIAPELARTLAAGMRNCEFTHFARPSHEILHLLRNRQMDVGVATRPMDDVSDLVEYPLVRDPFVVVTPISQGMSPEDYLAGKSTIPLIRYSQTQIIGRQIEAQLRRLRISLPNRIEMESNQSIIGMVADGSGWAITTPLSYLRARRFHGQTVLHPFPGKSFARFISIFTAEEYAQGVARMIANTMRRLIHLRTIEPAVQQIRWLEEGFYVLPERSGVNAGV
ncbi:LysR family transcriptional regulator [Hoeflea poritis]|uniref:LysR family transcriptional regulator n=1 Tax=Hoeflea poritis TaxID=2993659 RepID=A0ABT4VPI3_9HYPH|nr:LysR family transcriptional regulator [Hoeflea poritis]MDA4846627.1 LysR family transcriptional regulator [Hoeflea poritis]